MSTKKMGRPPVDNPKDKTLRIRIDDETEKKLADCSEALKINKSDIVRKGIDIIHDGLKK